MGVVTRNQQVPLIGHYLVHIVCDLHDALLGVAQVEVLVPVLQRDRDGQGSPDEERGGRQRGVVSFSDQVSAPHSTHQRVISNDEELHVLHGPPGISPHLQDRQQSSEERRSRRPMTLGISVCPDTAELLRKDI